ncbi:MAG: hypothetical protein ACXVCO_13705 [Ktedonobacterales bacterium]
MAAQAAQAAYTAAAVVAEVVVTSLWPEVLAAPVVRVLSLSNTLP